MWVRNGRTISEDVIPLTELKINPRKIVKQTINTHRPVLPTNCRQGVAVVQDLVSYEEEQEERAFFKAIAHGLMDIRENRMVSLIDAKKRLGLIK